MTKPMDDKTAAEVIDNHRDWRRSGDGTPTAPKLLSEALDRAVAALKAQGEAVHQIRADPWQSWVDVKSLDGCGNVDARTLYTRPAPTVAKSEAPND